MEDTVKAIEAKESAKLAKGKLGGRNVEVSRVETKSCFNCRGSDPNFTREGFQKCPARDKVCPKCGIQIHYKDTEGCKSPRAVSSRVRKPKTPRKYKSYLDNQLNPIQAQTVRGHLYTSLQGTPLNLYLSMKQTIAFPSTPPMCIVCTSKI